MPRYQKNDRIRVYYSANPYQDACGAWHEGEQRPSCTLWAHAQGVRFDEEFAAGSTWTRDKLVFTVTRPREFEVPHISDHIEYRGKFYQIDAVNNLVNTRGFDMKLYATEDPTYEVL